MGRGRRRKLYAVGLIAAAALAINVATAVLAYDRLPRFPNDDEVVMNDPAVAISEGKGLVGPSFGATEDLADLYAHQEPLFLFMQAGMIEVFGFSPGVVRGLPILAHLAYLLLLSGVAVWLATRTDRRWDGALFLVVLMLFEPTMFGTARWSRPDSLVWLFGVAAGLVLFISVSSGRPKLIWLSTFFMGISLALHLEALILWGGFTVAVWLLVREPGLRLALVSLPWVVPIGIWLLSHGARSWNALMQMRSIQSQALGVDLSLFAGGLTSPQGWLAVGAIPLMLLIAAAGASLLVLGRDLLRHRRPEGAVVACCIASGWAIAFIVGGAGGAKSRFLTALPVAVTVLSFLLSRLERGRVWVLRSLAIATLFAATMTAGYLLLGSRKLDVMAPDRYDELVDAIPRDARVAAVSQLWYELQSRDHDFRLLIPGLAPDREFWEEHGDVLATFDVIVMNQGNELLSESSIENYDRLEYRVGDELMVMLKRPD